MQSNECEAVEVRWLRFCESWVAIGLAACMVDVERRGYFREDWARAGVAFEMGYSTEGAT